MSDKNPIPLSNSAASKPSFVTWEPGDEKGRASALAHASVEYGKAQAMGIQRASASLGFRNAGGNNINVRNGFNNRDYEWFRPDEAMPVRDIDIIAACMLAYEVFPFVKHIIDMMSDFTVKGMRVVHPRVKVEAFGKEWAKKVNMLDRGERQASMLFRSGNVIMKRHTARIPDKTMDVFRSKADYYDGDSSPSKGPDTKINTNDPLGKNEIPYGFTILDPRAMIVVGGDMAPFIGPRAFHYAVRVPVWLQSRLKKPNPGVEMQLVQQLPVNVLDGANSAGRLIQLPPNQTVTMFYKRDDFLVWARPLLYSLLPHLQIYSKLMLADKAALDGIISHVRLWKLGSLEHRIFPTEAAVTRLSDMLLQNVGGGSIDLIWGPEIELVESKSDIAKILGQEKYIPTLHAIYQGLGIPFSLTGMVSDQGLTSGFTPIKLLMDRLAYARQKIKEVWEYELELLRRRFGFREPFTVVFEEESLTDETAMIKLLIDMVDRNIISAEYVVDRVGGIPEIEAMRLRRETKARESGKMPPQLGPFPQQQNQLMSSFVTQGHLTPSQVGLNVPDPKPGEKTPFEQQSEQKLKQASQKAAGLASKKKPRKGNGRPTGTKDTGPRKKKSITRSKAEQLTDALTWAGEALGSIEEVTKEPFLKSKARKNLRQLTTAEADEFERFKFAILCEFEPGTRVSKIAVKNILKAGDLGVPIPVEELYQATVARYVEKEGKQPTADKARQLQASVYALYKTDLENGDTTDG